MDQTPASDSTPFAIDKENRLCIKVAAVMSPLIACADGLKLIVFSGEADPYMLVTDAISWCEKEMQHHSRAKYEKYLTALNKAKEQHENETMEIVD